MAEHEKEVCREVERYLQRHGMIETRDIVNIPSSDVKTELGIVYLFCLLVCSLVGFHNLMIFIFVSDFGGLVDSNICGFC